MKIKVTKTKWRIFRCEYFNRPDRSDPENEFRALSFAWRGWGIVFSWRRWWDNHLRWRAVNDIDALIGDCRTQQVVEETTYAGSEIRHVAF